ncbi:hypothetical protein BGW39_002369 [Mortierella sp. 14UC]|nr:hypothetical protein BGW39_002369 [Mortierella sp. 14UC]
MKMQYDKCVEELGKTGNGNKGSVTMIQVIKKITPFYSQLVDIFDSMINGKYAIPSRESGARGKTTYLLNVEDLQT